MVQLDGDVWCAQTGEGKGQRVDDDRWRRDMPPEWVKDLKRGSVAEDQPVKTHAGQQVDAHPGGNLGVVERLDVQMPVCVGKAKNAAELVAMVLVFHLSDETHAFLSGLVFCCHFANGVHSIIFRKK